jgi:hypothetical protein
MMWPISFPDNVSWNNLCNLTVQQLSELQSKGYYAESGGSKKIKTAILSNGNMINYKQLTKIGTNTARP